MNVRTERPVARFEYGPANIEARLTVYVTPAVEEASQAKSIEWAAKALEASRITASSRTESHPLAIKLLHSCAGSKYRSPADIQTSLAFKGGAGGRGINPRIGGQEPA